MVEKEKQEELEESENEKSEEGVNNEKSSIVDDSIEINTFEDIKDDFFIGKTKLITSSNFKPIRNNLEKIVTKEMLEDAFHEEFKLDDEEEIEEVYVPIIDEESYNEVREEENVFENVFGSDFYKEKKDDTYSEDNSKKDKYAPIIRSNEFDDKRGRDSPIFNAGLSEEMKQSQKNKSSLN